MEYIQPKDLALPKGHYTPAIVHNQIVYVSGQLPIKQDGSIELGNIENQTELCMKNIQLILESAHSNLSHTIKFTIYTSNIDLWEKINNVYTNFLGNHKPARVVVPCATLHYGCSVEIECIAAVII